VESFTEFWYPVQGLDGGFVEATALLALNVNFFKAAPGVPQHVELSLFPTVPIQDAKVTLSWGRRFSRTSAPFPSRR